MNEPTIVITGIEYTVSGKRRMQPTQVLFDMGALDALSCFVNAWANHEDEDFSASFRTEMKAACEKAIDALNTFR